MDGIKRNWYAVYTKPRWEKKVAENLHRQNIEHYCPLNKVQRQWSDRKKLIYEPLFFSYVFIHVEPAQFIKVKQTNGVINIVHWLNKPAIIQDVEIEIIKRFLNDYDQVRLEKTKVGVADFVRISGGALMDNEGLILEKRNNFVKVALPSLGYNLVAEVEIQNVEFITYAKTGKIV